MLRAQARIQCCQWRLQELQEARNHFADRLIHHLTFRSDQVRYTMVYHVYISKDSRCPSHVYIACLFIALILRQGRNPGVLAYFWARITMPGLLGLLFDCMPGNMSSWHELVSKRENMEQHETTYDYTLPYLATQRISIVADSMYRIWQFLRLSLRSLAIKSEAHIHNKVGFVHIASTLTLVCMRCSFLGACLAWYHKTLQFCCPQVQA